MGWTMTLVRAVSALVLAAGSVVLSATPCLACSCVPRPPAKALADADAAFVGEVIGERSVSGGTMQRFRVDEVYAGTLAPEVEVHAQIGSGVVSSCAVLFSGGHEVALILATDEQGRLMTSSCSLITVAEMRRVGGEPRPPEAAVASVAPPTSGTVAAEGGADGAALPWWQVALSGLAIGLVLIGVSMVAGKRRGAPDPASPIPDEIPPPDSQLKSEA